MIHPDLANLATPIDDLHSLPGNPRRGDVEAVMRSYRQFGQRKPITALPDGTVTSGNHQLEAARRLGWTEMAVVRTDDDALTAKAWALADNRTADLGKYDHDSLLAMLADVVVDQDLLDATSYTEADIAKLAGDVAPLGDQSDDLTSTWSVVITCRDEGQQLEFIREFTGRGLECRALVA